MLTLAHLTQIMRHASHAKLERFLPHLNEAMSGFDITGMDARTAMDGGR